MLTACEVAVKSVLPALRGAVVRRLYRDFGMRQVEIAKALGITQPAVSHYLRGSRGAVIAVEGLRELDGELRNFAQELAGLDLSALEQRERFCRLCTIVRTNGLMCDVHKRYDPSVEGDGCTLCRYEEYCSVRDEKSYGG
ncbi:MAG: transcriptional regulator [Candidatus Bathyarchaeia archaeon]